MENEKEVVKQQIPYWFNPKYPKLDENDEVGKAALEHQVVLYPQIVRQNIDPVIPGHTHTIISFNLFEKPRMFRDQPIYGFVKVRGDAEDDKVAIKNANKLVLEVDSKFMMRVCRTGEWVPITESTSVIKDVYDVSEDKGTMVRNEEDKNKLKMLRTEANKGKDKETKRIESELKDREKQLKEGGDVYDKPESIEFYVTKRVTEMKLHETVQVHELKLEELKKKLGEQRIILKKLEQQYPTHSENWLEVYNQGREKISLPRLIPGEHQFEEYEEETLKSLLSKYPEPRPEATGGSSGLQNNPKIDDSDKDIITGTGGILSAKSYSMNLPEKEGEKKTDTTATTTTHSS